MKRGGKILISLISVVALAAGLQAAVNDSPSAKGSGDASEPYEAIWLRNIFDLKPPAVPVVVEEKPPVPPPNVHLTGITTIFGRKQALFMVQDQPAPGKPPEKEHSYMMVEGERRDKLEVLEIDTKNRKVKIKVEEVVSTITFETNRVSAPGGGPGGAPNPQFVPPPGLVPPNFIPKPPPYGNNSGFPGRDLRTPSYGGQPQAYQNNGYGGNGYNGAAGINSSSATSGVNGGGGSSLFNSPTTQNQNVGGNNVNNLNAEQATALFLLQQQTHAAEEKAGQYPPTPPIPGFNTGTTSDQNQQGSVVTPVNTITPPPFGAKGTGTLKY